MYWACALAILATLRCSTANSTIRGSVELDPHTWTLEDGTEAFKLLITVKMQYPVPNGWRMALIFTQPIKKVDVWRAKVIKTYADMKTHALMNMDFNPHLAMGEDLRMVVVAYKVNKGLKPGKIIVLFRGGNVIPTLPTLPPVSKNPASGLVWHFLHRYTRYRIRTVFWTLKSQKNPGNGENGAVFKLGTRH